MPSHLSAALANAAGRRREDDFNLVADPLGSGNDGTGRRTEDDPNLVAHPGVRRLTPVECERLQALPDGWTEVSEGAPDSRRYAALGDAVTSSVAEWIGTRLLAYLSARVPALDQEAAIACDEAWRSVADARMETVAADGLEGEGTE